MEEKRHDGYFKIGTNWLPTRKKEFKTALSAGMYVLKVDENGSPILCEKDNNYDDLIHLPGTAYEKVVDEIDMWLKTSTRNSYEKNGFLYKRSILLHGLPGGGKTSIVNRVAHEVIEKGGVVLFNVPPDSLNNLYEIIDEVEGNRLVMVILEELDQLVENYEESLLHVLDGEIQRENVVYVATTNYLDKVPKRIMRPGRFSLVLEVETPGKETREFYLNQKLADSTGAVSINEVKEWVEKTEGFTIDELKETVLAVKCLGYSLDNAVGKIKFATKESDKGISLLSEDDDYDPYDIERVKVKNLENEVKKVVKKLNKKQKELSNSWITLTGAGAGGPSTNKQGDVNKG